MDSAHSCMIGKSFFLLAKKSLKILASASSGELMLCRRAVVFMIRDGSENPAPIA